jgi:rubredoxin
MARLRRSNEELEAMDALLERLRDFIRLNYLTAAEVARHIGAKDTTVYDWLLGRARPAEPKRIAAFLDSVPRENGFGIAPTGYEYREYKNWRGIPKPRRCPFCKQAKGEVRRSRGGFLGVCPNCEARGPKRESYDEVLRAWNGRSEIIQGT